MKLITLLRALHPHEHREFEKFLSSPFFKASDMYLQFFREIRKRSSTFDLNKDQLHTAYRRCFGETSLNDTKWYNIASGLSKQIERFLVIQTITPSNDSDGENPLYDQLLVKALGTRNMGATFRTEADRVIAKTLDRKDLNPDDFLALQQVHRQVYFNPDTQKFGVQPEHLQSAGTYLDQYYCIELLRLAAEMKTRENILGVSHQQPLLSAVLEYSNAGIVSEKYPLWAMYRDLVKYYYQGGGATGFEQLTAKFKELFDRFSKNDRISLSRHLINIGISLSDQYNNIEITLFEIYKLLEKKRMLLDDNRITYMSFINIANLAAVCGDFEWDKNFINEYQHFLEEDKREPTVNLAKASICYYEKNLEAAEAYLMPEKTKVPPFDILNMGLSLKIIFDKYWIHGIEYEYLISRIETFRRFIRHKKIPPQRKKAYTNWANMLRRMTTVRFEKAGHISPAVRAKLLRELEETRPVVFKNWTAARLTET